MKFAHSYAVFTTTALLVLSFATAAANAFTPPMHTHGVYDEETRQAMGDNGSEENVDLLAEEIARLEELEAEELEPAISLLNGGVRMKRSARIGGESKGLGEARTAVGHTLALGRPAGGDDGTKEHDGAGKKASKRNGSPVNRWTALPVLIVTVTLPWWHYFSM